MSDVQVGDDPEREIAADPGHDGSRDQALQEETES